MDYVIIVNDNGELKTISATEFEAVQQKERFSAFVEHRINSILDLRALEQQTDELTRRRALHKDDGDLPEYGGN